MIGVQRKGWKFRVVILSAGTPLVNLRHPVPQVRLLSAVLYLLRDERVLSTLVAANAHFNLLPSVASTFKHQS